ncbi:hypothetical protein RUM44_001132 [Polyplax serrata]|uniref:Uncharacterized protein n=1 Tax=Polyplax serrata TaxID=468196 RepID=A0ABR1B9L2_POLSC
MPIDLVIDERDPTAKPLELGGSTNGNEGTRSNADSTSHTDGASTPDVKPPWYEKAKPETDTLHNKILPNKMNEFKRGTCNCQTELGSAQLFLVI